jgi:hypothetical protein
MSGISYLVDAAGNRSAVVIDLKKHGALWEDFQDQLVVAERAGEPRESMQAVKRRLQAKQKRRG